jgi:hypothetical protein
MGSVLLHTEFGSFAPNPRVGQLRPEPHGRVYRQAYKLFSASDGPGTTTRCPYFSARVFAHLANAQHQIVFCCDCAAEIRAVNPISFWHTDPEHVVKVLGVVMLFPKIRAHIFRELVNNMEHGPYKAVQRLAFHVAV